MRRTDDNITVSPKEPVFEIMYRYYNAEASGVAEPEQRLAEDVPADRRIWKYRNNCAYECMRINKRTNQDKNTLIDQRV